MRLFLLTPTILASGIIAATINENADGGCNTGFAICAPDGATSSAVPQIGSAAFANLFVDLVDSSLPASTRKRTLSGRATASLCCDEQLSCLTMASLGIPFCYDRFTTNYFLPDGSFGTVVGGTYTNPKGDTANLETGDYTLANSGQKGNLYSSDPAEKPNTVVLPMPSQFTGTGVGSAVPASGLGVPVTLTYATTMSGSAIQGMTVSATVIPGSVHTETISNTIIASTGLPITIQGKTVMGTSVVPYTTSVTMTQEKTGSTSAATSAGARSQRANYGSKSYLLLLVALYL